MVLNNIDDRDLKTAIDGPMICPNPNTHVVAP